MKTLWHVIYLFFYFVCTGHIITIGLISKLQVKVSKRKVGIKRNRMDNSFEKEKIRVKLEGRRKCQPFTGLVECMKCVHKEIILLTVLLRVA